MRHTRLTDLVRCNDTFKLNYKTLLSNLQVQRHCGAITKVPDTAINLRSKARWGTRGEHRYGLLTYYSQLQKLIRNTYLSNSYNNIRDRSWECKSSVRAYIPQRWSTEVVHYSIGETNHERWNIWHANLARKRKPLRSMI